MNRSEPPHFLDPRSADSEGIVQIGGQLTPQWLLAAYSRGIFPWPIEFPQGYLLAWFSPDPRAILRWHNLHIPHRLARRLKRSEFEFTCDRAFQDVVRLCAAPRKLDRATWITQEVFDAYSRFHELGYAHSIEVWQRDRLVGGLYGVAIGGLFCGESMFHRVRDASKAAVVVLCAHLHHREFELFDIQQATDHMIRLGAEEIPREQYLDQAARAVGRERSFGDQADFRNSAASLTHALQRGTLPWSARARS